MPKAPPAPLDVAQKRIKELEHAVAELTTQRDCARRNAESEVRGRRVLEDQLKVHETYANILRNLMRGPF